MVKKSRREIAAAAIAAVGASTLLPTLTVIAAPAITGWRQVGDNWYYYNSDGTKATNCWALDSSGHWFYLGSDGAMITNGWAQDSSGRWFNLGNDGKMVTNGWAQDSSKKWFYLGSDGAMVTSTWVEYKGIFYYLNAGGDMAFNTTTPDGYFVDASGARAVKNVADLNDGNIHNGNYVISSLGSYGITDEGKTTTINGNVVINYSNGTASDVITLNNLIINGTITVNFGEGKLLLNNVKATEVNLANVGSHSMELYNTFIGTLNVNDANNDAHIIARGNTNITSTNIFSGANLETGSGIAGTNPFGNVSISPTQPPSNNNVVTLNGVFRNLSIMRPSNIIAAPGSMLQGVSVSADLNISGTGRINDLNVNSSNVTAYLMAPAFGTVGIGTQAINSRIIIPSGTTVGTLNVNAPASVAGQGSIARANVGASGTTIETTPARISILSGVSITVSGEVRNDSNTRVVSNIPSTGGATEETSTGGGGSSTVKVNTIAVSGAEAAVTVANGGTLQMSAAITPANATNKTIVWSVINGTGSAIINENGLLTGTAAGTVTVKAENAASGVIGTKEITVFTTNKTGLTAAITAEIGADHSNPVYVLTPGDYTTASWTNYTNAVAAAIAIEGNVNAGQSTIDSAASAMGIAKAGLEFVNKAAMTQSVEDANGKVEADYSTASWGQFLTARTAAMAMPATTNSEMGARTTALNEAMALLKTDKIGLTAAITAEVGADHSNPVYVLTQADYTTVSWTNYTSTVAAAIAVEGNANAVQSAIDSATSAIGTAKTELVFANKEAMENAVTAANGKVDSNYTAASWGQFVTARTIAMAMPATTNSEMGARTTALNEAMALLKIDKTALTAAITAEVGTNHSNPVYVLTQGDYTTATWTAYTSAVAAAIAVEENADAGQSAIDSAAPAISTAKAGLVFANKEAMENAVTAANGKVESDYSTASWGQFVTARTAAMAMPAATNAQMGARTTKLNEAMALLTTDKTGLTAVITAEVGSVHSTPVYVLIQGDYTTATWTTYSNAAAAAIAVEGDVNAVQSAIDSATAAIGTAKAGLVFANKEAMENAVTAANGKVESDYSTASWGQFVTARTTAMAMPATTNAQMGAKTTALNEAMALLTTDKTGLTAVITAEVGSVHENPAYVLTKGDYTTATWSNYASAIVAALAVEGNASAVQSAIDSAAAAIGTTKAGLVFANKEAMENAVTAANGKVESDYTAVSWGQFITDRTTALSMPATTNSEMGLRTTALNEAMALLKTDKTALTAAINDEVGIDHSTPAYILATGDYTIATWTAYTNAIAAAITVEGNASAGQSAIDSAAAAIGTAKADLVFANKAAMDQAVTEANGKVETDYTTASWSQFVSARTTALSMPATTNSEMGARTTALNAAMALLKIDKTELTAAITAEVGTDHSTPLYALTQGDYTTATWTAYSNALAAAIAVEANASAVQSAIDSATAAIDTEKAKLVFANKAAMVQAVAEANGKVQSDYTAASWSSFAAARTTALALPATTNGEMGDRTAALNAAIALLVEAVPETLTSIAITDFNYGTIYATQASITSKTITTSNFGPGNNKSFTVTDSSGNSIPVNLTWDIPQTVNDQPATAATVVGSAVESFIQMYFWNKGGNDGLMNRTLWASGSGDTFNIGAFGPGPTGSITISGPDASYFFDTLHVVGTGDDNSKNKVFTINDGTTTATVNLNYSYTDMAALVNKINNQLSSSQVYAQRIDDSHFKLVTKIRGIHFTIDGASKAFFFSSFESQ